MVLGVFSVALALGSSAPNNTVLPTLFPPWKPVWTLHRSTIAMPCNYSGQLFADETFFIVTFFIIKL